ncbi:MULTISPECIES: hypothetical protein [Maricaulis]|uniref:Uncharacterized protein n=1 Tax=Maricaulis maris TaxID=74318 RepID=A0A495DJD2_9PROT|nr:MULTISPECIES: hypothetical protein [Maricaulis]RKR02705.1 hypothetical protein C7435_0644 [Maricaulis maris]
MKTTAIILGGALAVSLLAVNCPQSVRTAVTERTQIPDHVYEEAERQLDVFVSWARNDANVPQMAPRELPAS